MLPGMITLPLYQVDAFAREVFRGNPAAVCPLAAWLPDATLQSIAAENNLAETAFFLGENGRYRLRWFTPAVEVDLCGHATLASAWVVFHCLEPERDTVIFDSHSGPLIVTRDGDRLTLDFPVLPYEAVAPLPELNEALGAVPVETFRSRDYVALYDSEEAVLALRPDMARLATLDCLGIIATAPGRECDFVSRFFAPGAGIPEDPVTGSAHCTLTPLWARRLGKTRLHARQVSARGGELFCAALGERVRISGHAALYLEGTIRVPPP